MKTILALLLGLVLSTSALCESYQSSSGFRIENAEKKDHAAIDLFLLDAMARLPQAIKTLVATKKPKLRFASSRVSNQDLLQLLASKERAKVGEYGQNAFSLDAILLPDIRLGKDQQRPYPGAHKTAYLYALAALIHEAAHFYDESLDPVFSTSQSFRHATDFRKNPITGNFFAGNREITSPDPYEYTNPQEKFAVNMEYFLLDDEFACRRPFLNQILVDHFGSDPLSHSRKCQIPLEAASSIRLTREDLNPDRIYRIDYVKVQEGPKIYSGFGHSLIRLVRCAAQRYNPINDTTIEATPFSEQCLKDRDAHLYLSYAADTFDLSVAQTSRDRINEMRKLIWGETKARLFLLSHKDVMFEFTKLEDRTLQIHPLKFRPHEKKLFIYKALEHIHEFQGRYKAQKSNCATYSENLIRSSTPNPAIQENKSRLPSRVIRDLVKSGLLEKGEPEEVLPSTYSELLSELKRFSSLPDPEAFLGRYLIDSAPEHRLEQARLTINQNPTGPTRELVASFIRLERFVIELLDFQLSKQGVQHFLADPERRDQVLAFFAPEASTDAANGLFRYGLPLPSDQSLEADESEKLEQFQQLRTLFLKWIEKQEEYVALQKSRQNIDQLRSIMRSAIAKPKG